jgi:hypothetical protein
LRIALFITCFNDTLFPQTGRAAVEVLERLGQEVVFSEEQTCCGQMHFNGGYHEEALGLIRRFVRVFAGEETIVTPSGWFLYVSCWGTGEMKQFDVSDPANPKQVGSVRLGGIVDRAAHPAKADMPLAGGPQMVEVSRDGRRVYFTNSLYGSWDDQFYPDGVGAWMAKLDVGPDGGLSIDGASSRTATPRRARTATADDRIGGGDPGARRRLDGDPAGTFARPAGVPGSSAEARARHRASPLPFNGRRGQPT